MGSPNIKWVPSVIEPSDNSKFGNPYVPTTGLPASAIDFYRARHIIADDYVVQNPCLIDHSTVDDILAFNFEIRSLEQLLRFEQIIQKIVLYDRVDVFSPCVKVEYKENGLLGFQRTEESRISDSMSFFNNIGSFDLLFPTEKLFIKRGRIKRTTSRSSFFLEKKASEIGRILSQDRLQVDLLPALALHFGLPFLSKMDPILEEFAKGFQKHWEVNMRYAIQTNQSLSIPIFTHLALALAKERGKVLDGVMDLRERFKVVRKKLHHFIWSMKGNASPKEINAIRKDLDHFIETTTSKVYDDYSILHDITSLIVDFKKSPLEVLNMVTNSRINFDSKYPSMFRNQSHKIISHLLELDNSIVNVDYFFTQGEIVNLTKQISGK